MRRFLLLLLLFLALALLAFFCIRHHAPAIEADLQARSTAALSAAGFADATASLDGRDVLLTGRVASEALRRQAEATIRAVDGTARITNRLQVTEGAASTATTAGVTAGGAKPETAVASAKGGFVEMVPTSTGVR